MRLSHYLLITATIGWMAVALVWGVNRFGGDITFAPIELVYMGAFAISALIGGLIFDRAGAIAMQAEFGGLNLMHPKDMITKYRRSRREHREWRERLAEERKSRKQRNGLRRW